MEGINDSGICRATSRGARVVHRDCVQIKRQGISREAVEGGNGTGICRATGSGAGTVQRDCVEKRG